MTINPFDIDFEIYNQFLNTVDWKDWKIVLDIGDEETQIWIWIDESQVEEVLNQFKILSSDLVTKEEISRRNLDDDGKLEDSQEEGNYAEDRSLPSSIITVIIVGIFVLNLCTIVAIFIIMKIAINHKNKKTVQENLKKYEEEFNLRMVNFNIDTENIMFEQTDCAICLCEFGIDDKCRVIKAWQHVFHLKWIKKHYDES